MENINKTKEKMSNHLTLNEMISFYENKKRWDLEDIELFLRITNDLKNYFINGFGDWVLLDEDYPIYYIADLIGDENRLSKNNMRDIKNYLKKDDVGFDTSLYIYGKEKKYKFVQNLDNGCVAFNYVMFKERLEEDANFNITTSLAEFKATVNKYSRCD